MKAAAPTSSVLSGVLDNVGISDVLDVAVVAILVYVLLLALKQTRTTFLIVGIGILTGVYLLALSFGLRLTSYLFQLLFTVILIGLIVLFHEEIRVSVERFLSWQFRGRRGARPDSVTARAAETLVGTVTDLARERIGALIVIRGKDDLERFTRGGSPLDGTVSQPLLKSIFDPHSMGHDGAVLLEADRVVRFGSRLPLSTNNEQIGNRGTRHAAALGIAEKTDCLCLVVSEERGTVSIARDGRLEEMPDLSAINRVLGDFHRRISPPPRARSFLADALGRHLGLKAAALVAALLLWFLVVHESSTEYRSFTVALEPVGLRGKQSVASIEPPTVRVIVSGPRRSFYLTKDNDLSVDLKLFDRAPGEHEIFLTATDVRLPDGLTFVNLIPRLVDVTVQE